jgi:outer membrane protein assembly factor BamB
MNRSIKVLIGIIVSTIGCILILFYQLNLEQTSSKPKVSPIPVAPLVVPVKPLPSKVPSSNLLPSPYKGTFETKEGAFLDLELLNASFLHNHTRNYYGDSAPSQLAILWKHKLGGGSTKVGAEVRIWKGAGWTGQPLLVAINGKKYLIQGAYDHHLKKIDAKTGMLVWQYKYDDVIKGTGTLWLNRKADSLKNFCVILQGSRAGKSIYSTNVPSYRAISLFTGEELWRLNSIKTDSYSRDVDASALLVNDTAYIGLENGIFAIFDPNPTQASIQKGMLQPKIYKDTDTLYLKSDQAEHGGNLVTEGSPTLLRNRIYIASGSGHIWGYNLDTDSIDWDYFIGSDIDGSPVVTEDSCLLVTIEKQHIKGQGGVLKLDPQKKPKDAVEWFFPTEDKSYSTWDGGVIGSTGVNCASKQENSPNLAVFTAIDGFMYVINTDKIDQEAPKGTFDSTNFFPQPQLVFKYKTGPAISTPIIVQDKIIAATYRGVHLFVFDEKLNFKLLETLKIRCESTPLVDAGKVYIASRNGYLYCLGGKDSTLVN